MAFEAFYKMIDERSDLMSRMMVAMDVQAGSCSSEAEARSLRDASRNCMLCKSTGQCQTWLNEEEVAGRLSEPTFCPNYERFLEQADAP
ncbi:MAG: DUF6455 family protein [Pseudomonadota bacterium]